jgi:hypothetical protein
MWCGCSKVVCRDGWWLTAGAGVMQLWRAVQDGAAAAAVASWQAVPQVVVGRDPRGLVVEGGWGRAVTGDGRGPACSQLPWFGVSCIALAELLRDVQRPRLACLLHAGSDSSRWCNAWLVGHRV